MFGGDTVQFRYRLGTDDSVGIDGWYLDDVKVQSCSNGTHDARGDAGRGHRAARSFRRRRRSSTTARRRVHGDAEHGLRDRHRHRLRRQSRRQHVHDRRRSPPTARSTRSFAALPDVTVTIDDGRALRASTADAELRDHDHQCGREPRSAASASATRSRAELDLATATWVCHGGAGGDLHGRAAPAR